MIDFFHDCNLSSQLFYVLFLNELLLYVLDCYFLARLFVLSFFNYTERSSSISLDGKASMTEIEVFRVVTIAKICLGTIITDTAQLQDQCRRNLQLFPYL